MLLKNCITHFCLEAEADKPVKISVLWEQCHLNNFPLSNESAKILGNFHALQSLGY